MILGIYLSNIDPGLIVRRQEGGNLRSLLVTPPYYSCDESLGFSHAPGSGDATFADSGDEVKLIYFSKYTQML
jgi:hypothetical protein